MLTTLRENPPLTLKLIKRYDLTTGNIHDSQVFESMLTGTEKEAYADSA